MYTIGHPSLNSLSVASGCLLGIVCLFTLQEIDAVKISNRVALKMIGQGGFGYTFALDGSMKPTTTRSFELLSSNTRSWWYTSQAIVHFRLLSPVCNALAIPGLLLLLVSTVLPASILRFLGERVLWPTLNHIIEVVDRLYMHSKGI
jgi:hypothetical protein